MSSLRVYEKKFEVRWSDCDANGHLRHSAYGDYATHVRFAYLVERGYSPERFREQGIAPTLMREEVRFLREVHHAESVRVDFHVEGLSEDGSRWKVFHYMLKESGKRAAIISVDGSFMDIETRKLRPPPDDLFEVMRALPVGRVPNYRLLRF